MNLKNSEYKFFPNDALSSLSDGRKFQLEKVLDSKNVLRFIPSMNGFNSSKVLSTISILSSVIWIFGEVTTAISEYVVGMASVSLAYLPPWHC